MIAHLRLSIYSSALVVCLLLISTINGPAQDQSIASRPNGSLWGSSPRVLAADVRAHKVGDTVTILVSETSSASSTATTKTSKDDNMNFGGVPIIGSLLKPLGIKGSALNPLAASNKNSSNGTGQTNRSGSLVTKLSAVVKEVLPNGNMLIEGSRIVGVNSEKQKVMISGVVRPQDIQPDNTVSSVSMANAVIQYDGKGTVGDKQHRGILASLFGWLF